VTSIDIRPNNTLDQNFATVPHEIFHRVQYQYNRTANQSGLYAVIREGGARFIEDAFHDNYNRYIFQSQEIFNSPWLSLVTPPGGCGNPIAYASALFWKYLAEQHSTNTSCSDEPHIGIDTYHQILKTNAVEPGTPPKPYEVSSLRTACSLLATPGSFDEFHYFDPGKSELSTNETVWGNYLVANYLHGKHAVPPGERRFSYMEEDDPVTWPLTTSKIPRRVRKLALLSPKINADDAVILRRDSVVERTVIGQPPYAARYYRITPSWFSQPRMVRVSLSAFGEMKDPLIQILRFGPNGVLVDIAKSDQPSYSKSINMTDLTSVIVIVASRMDAGNYTVDFEEIEGGPDVMITRWNSAPRTEYEVNPRDYLWTHTSPDLKVDSNYDTAPDTDIMAGHDNKLFVGIHNRGTTKVSGVRVDLYYQPAAPQLDPALWVEVQSRSNTVQIIKDLTVNAGDRKWAEVDWSPPANVLSAGWCVKATITSPGDINRDNKIAIGCFTRSYPPVR
jgi:hypothetical protein